MTYMLTSEELVMYACFLDSQHIPAYGKGPSASQHGWCFDMCRGRMKRHLPELAYARPLISEFSAACTEYFTLALPAMA